MVSRGMRPTRVPLVLTLTAALLAAPTSAAPRARGTKPKPAATAPASPALVAAIREEAGGDLRRFYAERGYRPLWIRSGTIGREAETLIGWLASADLDGLKPSAYDIDELRAAVAAARGGSPKAQVRAETALSAAFARYVRDQRAAGKARMTWADRSLKPRKADTATVLRAAAFPKDFAAYIAGMDWMSEHYVRLRALTATARRQGASKAELARLRRNLDRARLLPGPWVHHIVVDASSGQLWYYGGGKQEGTMRVVVGAKETQTPMLAGKLQWAILNPYWNVPDYLAEKSIAPKILAGRSLASLNMEALSDWGANPRRLSQDEIDWPAVAAGKTVLRLRELPGGANSMGRVKFLFPNSEGIYLHDTPDRALLARPDRHFSNGCIRLENAAALGRWLMHRPIATKSKAPEQAVALPVQVPVYLTYITATATKKGLAFREDVYGRDG